VVVPHTGRESLRRWDPERIGPYVILGRLGAGSMGQVYLGRSAAGRLVAVKTIKVGLAEEANFRTRFAQEVVAARRVSGAFTAAVIEADPDADMPWLATAYVPAPSLNRLVRVCGPLPVHTVRWLAAGCAEALGSIHGVGLVHRDLKPSNVLVAPDGPRVIDFGVARAAERMELTTARGAVGTPEYMAPEQARDNRHASLASDVYSLGATLVFAATGHPPYQGDTVLDVLARLATEEPDIDGLPDELAPLIGACLQRDPRLRPTSSALLARLGRFDETLAEEHSYLPESMMALIGEYQRNPLLAGGGQQGEEPDEPEDPTSASYTELPASYRPPAKRRNHRSHQVPPAEEATEPENDLRRLVGRSGRWIGTHLAWVGWASVGAALITVGVILGASLTSSGTPAPGPPNGGPPPAPQYVCPQGLPATGPGLCMVRTSEGSPDTPYMIHGRGFAPGTSITVQLTEAGPPPGNTPVITPPAHAIVHVGSDGTFSVLTSRIFPGSFPLGQVTVTATGSDGRTATAQFIVLPAAASPG
jgi:serine/threonine protein kinase